LFAIIVVMVYFYINITIVVSSSLQG
jgi:hypothetical protein